MIGYHDINIINFNILLMLDDRDTEDCMDAPVKLHMNEPYDLQYQIHDTDTPTYLEAL